MTQVGKPTAVGNMELYSYGPFDSTSVPTLLFSGELQTYHTYFRIDVEYSPFRDDQQNAGYLGVADGTLEGFDYFGVAASNLPRVAGHQWP